MAAYAQAHTHAVPFEIEVNGKIVVHTVGAIGLQSEIRCLGQERALVGYYRKKHASLYEDRENRDKCHSGDMGSVYEGNIICYI